MDQRGHLNRKLRFQGFCRFIRLIERVFWPFYSTVRSDMHYWLAFSWPYNLLSDKVLRITVYSCANASAGPNGLTLDRHGQVLAAEHDGRRVTRVAEDGTRTVLAERFQGKRLNSPNDIVVKSDGALYFTDPPYGVQPPTPGVPRPEGWWSAPIPGKELSVNGVYRLTPDGTLHLVVDDFALPNGLAFAPDESILYIDDSAHKHIRAFDRSEEH